MKYWIATAAFAMLLIIASIRLSSAQTIVKHFEVVNPNGDNVTMSADHIERDIPGQVVKLTGKVRIRTKDMVLTADEADYSMDTADIALRGQVHVKLAKQN